MGFFTSTEEDNTEEGIRARMKKDKMLYVQRLIDKEEYEARITKLEAQLAALSVTPPRTANQDAQLQELDYLRGKGWISQEDYETRKKEILGEE